MTHPAPGPPELSRDRAVPARVLGTVDASCVVIGAIIGVGIFFTPSTVASLAGSSGLALAAWVIAGVVALCGALVFAELGRRYTREGAQYHVLRDAWGALPAFVFVFCNATAIQAGAIAIIAIVCARNLGVATGTPVPDGMPLVLAAGALIICVTAANAWGVRWGSRIQNFTVLVKLGALLAIVALAMTFSPTPLEAPVPNDLVAGTPAGPRTLLGTLGIPSACLVPAFFAYGGWQHALWISGEVKNPRSTLPRAILAGVLAVVLVYLLANWAYLALLGVSGVASSKTLDADAVATVFPTWGGRAIAGAVALSAFGVLNAQLLSGPRLIQAMSRDGRFFAPFAAISTRRSTPVRAIVLLGAMGLVLLGMAGEKGVGQLLTGVVFVDGVFFALTAAALFRLNPAPGDGGRRLPLVLPAALVFLVGETGLLIGAHVDGASRKAALVGIAWMIAAGILFACLFHRPGARGPVSS